jgi:hypothetical protein
VTFKEKTRSQVLSEWPEGMQSSGAACSINYGKEDIISKALANRGPFLLAHLFQPQNVLRVMDSTKNKEF